MQINEKEIQTLSRYIVDYLAAENVAGLDSFLIMNAIESYLGGAAETE
jgi:hypothetical protein